MWSTQTVGYYSAMKKNKIMPFATTRMDLAMITLREISQTEKHKYHKLSLICGISKKKKKIQINLFIKLKQTL